MHNFMYLCKLKIAIFNDYMTQVKINDSVLRKAAEAGMDEFVQAFVDAIRNALGGELNAQNMAELNSDQITLLAWDVLHQEMMDGGMVQLIHNGYGGFIFKNPTDKAFRNWGVAGLYKLINKAHKCYNLAHEDIERDMSDEDSWLSMRSIRSLMISTMISLRMRSSGLLRWLVISTSILNFSPPWRRSSAPA